MKKTNNFCKMTRFLVLFTLIIIGVTCNAIPSRAALADKDEIWTGWVKFESGLEGARSAGADGGAAYGLGQFDENYALWDFVGELLTEDSTKYAAFSELYEKYKDKTTKISQNSEDTTKMINAWWSVYDDDPEGFTFRQIEALIDRYYYPAVSQMQARGIDITSADYSPVIRGTLMSIAVWGGQGGLSKVVAGLNSSMTESEMLDACYTSTTSELKGTDSTYIDSFRKRWESTQKNLAAQDYSRYKRGTAIPTTYSANLQSMFQGSVVQYAANGEIYRDFLKDWIEKYPDLAKGFIESGGWNKQNREWALYFKNESDWYEDYGIVENNVFADMVGGGTGAVYIGDINAENFQIPDNGSNNPVVYFSQGGGQQWSSRKFGGGTIATSGCSVTALAMVISYLKGGSDGSKWVYPSDVVNMIAEKTGDYNHFYNRGSSAGGQLWTIMDAVAGYYDLNCYQIESTDIISSLEKGWPVIMSCVPGEFTQGGHFIVITGIDDNGYLKVNDPNASHASKSSNSYKLSYLITQGKGWWAFSN